MIQHYDIIVAGGGLAGVAAAVAAERHGVQDVLLVERYGFLGWAWPRQAWLIRL